MIIRTGIITGSLTDTGSFNDVTINRGLPPRELIKEPNNNFRTNIISWKKFMINFKQRNYYIFNNDNFIKQKHRKDN